MLFLPSSLCLGTAKKYRTFAELRWRWIVEIPGSGAIEFGEQNLHSCWMLFDVLDGNGNLITNPFSFYDQNFWAAALKFFEAPSSDKDI